MTDVGSRLTVLVVARFGEVEASVHDSPERAMARLHGLVLQEWNIEGPVPDDPQEAIREFFAGLGHYADYALVPVDLGMATIGPDPNGLSRQVEPRRLPALEVFDSPPSLSRQRLEVGRLSKLCPSTGRPDQFRVEVVCIPTGGCCLELDSLVRYLEAFHHLAISAEVLADQVAVAVLGVTGASRVEVTVHQTGREGAELQVTACYPAASGHPTAAGSLAGGLPNP